MNLAGRYFIAFCGFATAGFTAFALVEALPAYRENVERAGQMQRLETRMAATRIEAFLEAIETQIHAVNQLPWDSDLLTLQDHREEFHRLLALNPAIFEIRLIGHDGRERLRVSQSALDRIDGGEDASAEVSDRLHGRSIGYSRAYFRSGSQPYVSLAMRATGADSDVVIAEVNLRLVGEVVEGMRIGQSGEAYIVDRANYLLAHPNLSLVHRKVGLSSLPQIAQARQLFTDAAASAANAPEPAASAASRAITLRGRSPDRGDEVVTSAVYIAKPEWMLFAEQPIDEVMAPVKATLYRTLGLLLALLLASVAVSLVIARKLTRPILELQRGAAGVSGGDLTTRVNVATGDEVEMLANEFNRMADNLARSYSELETRVDARTRELSKAGEILKAQAGEVETLNRQLTDQLGELAQSRDEAERANAAKSRFLAAASHDLRQPMHTVSLLVGILRERLRGREGRDLIDKVQISVHSMERRFNSLLDISRLDAGAVRPNVTQIPLQVLFDEIVENYAPQARAKGLDFRAVATRAIVRTDITLLERIVGNLVANAIHYTRKGGVLVGTRRRREGLSLVVCDTGIGIAQEHLAEIFEEFFQIEDARGEQGQGLGLGLSIVKRSAALLRLPLRVSSRLGSGSTFELGLPVVADAGDPSTSPSPEAMRDIEGAFVVVIDDEAENRFATEALCTQWGCHVVSGSSAADAIGELAHHLRAPDLIVTDYRLRGRLTGAMAIDDIRRHVDAHIPAIIVTGDLAARSLPNRDDVVLLQKPLDPDQLRVTMSRILARTGALR